MEMHTGETTKQILTLLIQTLSFQFKGPIPLGPTGPETQEEIPDHPEWKGGRQLEL